MTGPLTPLQREQHIQSGGQQAGLEFDYLELRSLVDRNADGILVLDHDGLVQFANQSALALFGRTAEELAGRRLGLPLAAGETTSIEIIRSDGAALEVEMRVVETAWHGKQARLASLRDISERRRLEEQLRHSQKMEAIGRLTAGVAHDFNNLLTIVLGNLDTLRRRLPVDITDPRIARSVENATSGAVRAAELTHQLLAYSRRQPLTPRPVNLATLLAGMDDLLSRTLGVSIRVSIEVAPDTWPVMVDPSQLEAALINLSVNARDAMDKIGELTIRVSNCAGHEVAGAGAGDYVCLSIADTGAGIPAELKAQVFEPFFTTKKVGEGTGLGLSLVYGFVNQSAGQVILESEEGQGTTVRLYLPRHDGVVEAAAKRPSAVAATGARGRRTVLLVEDETDLREWARIVLEELGYEVIEAGSAEEAMAVLRSDRELLLLFSDVSLPGDMDGVCLAEQAARERPSLATLITTAFAGDRLVENGRLTAGTHLLSKPYTRSQLKRAVEEITGTTNPLILLVEDDQGVRQAFVDCLRELGCAVDEASTAKAAMNRILEVERPISAGILDLELPDGHGMTLVEALKHHHGAAAAIVTSGYVGPDEAHAIAANDALALLRKPFSCEELKHLLVNLGVVAAL